MVREKIVYALVEHLKEIRAKNGYSSEAGLGVYEWLTKPLQRDQFPAIIVRDIADEVQDDGVFEHRLKIEIDIATKSKETLLELREIVADVLRAIGAFESSEHYRCESLSSEFLLEHKESLFGAARVEFVVIYKTARWQQ